MTTDVYQRFNLARTSHVSDAHVSAFELELSRLARALDADDKGDAIGSLKSAAEAVAKIVHDLDGKLVSGSADFAGTVKSAHTTLAGQQGQELAYESSYGKIATQASKIVGNLGAIRNDYGSGHGKARQPEIKDEMLALALDGTLLWLKWALRRLDSFAQGRPEALIRDLVGDTTTSSITFYSGDLAKRLEAANLGTSDPNHARAIGVAVGQRASSGTFNVSIDGIEPALADADLVRWPAPYRVGVGAGLLFDPSEISTIRARTLLHSLQICLPVTDSEVDITVLIGRVIKATPTGAMLGDTGDKADVLALIERQTPHRPPNEQAAWSRLSGHFSGTATAQA